MVVPARRFEVQARVGRGPAGTVYRTRILGAEGFTKVVALKLLDAARGDDDEAAVRLRDEARMLGLVRHRAIVQSEGLVRVEGRQALVMEFVDGVTLDHLAGRVPLGVALEVVAEIAGALHAGWTAPSPDGGALKLLHRDVRAANVLVTALGEVKLLDFGAARAEFAAREARTRVVHVDADSVLAPEGFDMTFGPEGDVYALGGVLFQLLLGEPFGRASANPARHEELRERRISALAEALGPAGAPVADLARRMLAYAATDRPSARDVERACVDLRPALAGPSLRDWAEAVVPALRATRDAGEADPLVGRVLYEGDGPVPEPAPVAPVAAPPRRGRAAALFGAVLLAVGLAAWLTRPPPAPVVAASAEPPRPAAIAPVPAAPEPPAPTPPAPAEPPSRPSPARPTRPATSATVTVAGDAEEIALVGPDRRYAPGAVPPGEYRVEARFPGRGWVPAGRVVAVAGGAVRVTCSATFSLCRAE